jgi:hypothetical protein
MKKIILILLVLTISSCSMAAKRKAEFDLARNTFYKDFSEDRIASKQSILVVPPVNNTVNVNASKYFLSAVSYPIAEKGYYVFPVNLVKRVMEDEGMSDANLVHSSNPQILAELFGADAVLYTTIDRCDAKYAGISTLITFTMSYVLKSGKDGSVLWKSTQSAVYDSNQDLGNSGSLVELAIKMIINAMISKASEEGKYFPLAKQSNIVAFQSGTQHLPDGVYLVAYNKSEAEKAAKKAQEKGKKRDD